MQMRQIWTRRWIAGNNTLHSSNWGGSRSQHSLLFCCFHKKAACVVGKFPLGWVQRVRSWGINSLSSHDTGLPWDYTHTACQGWHKTLHWEHEEKPLSHFCWPHVWWAGSLLESAAQMVGSMWQIFLGVILFSMRAQYIAALEKPSGKGRFLALRMVHKTQVFRWKFWGL